MDVAGCIACDLTSGRQAAPGGRVHETAHWLVEHCVGPLGVGTLLVKPFRHCLHVGDLSADESAELGPLLRVASACVQELNAADQVYVCLWSHADWKPGHIHFVVQPASADQRERHPFPGPALQMAMFGEAVLPAADEAAAFCERARAWTGWDER